MNIKETLWHAIAMALWHKCKYAGKYVYLKKFLSDIHKWKWHICIHYYCPVLSPSFGYIIISWRFVVICNHIIKRHFFMWWCQVLYDSKNKRTSFSRTILLCWFLNKFLNFIISENLLECMLKFRKGMFRSIASNALKWRYLGLFRFISASCQNIR